MNSNKKPKKLTVMDYITIGFTVCIVVVMVVVLITTIVKNYGPTDSNTTVTAAPSSTSAPTIALAYEGTGNEVHNMSLPYAVRVINGRTYFTQADRAGETPKEALYVQTEAGTKKLVTEDAITSLSVIEDPFAYSDSGVEGMTTYRILYIDADGAIKTFLDGPYASNSGTTVVDDDQGTITVTPNEPDILIPWTGIFKSFIVSDGYIYAINNEGKIVKYSLLDLSVKVNLSVNSYLSLTIYNKYLYALREDGTMVLLTTAGRTTEADTSELEPGQYYEDSNELAVTTDKLASFSIANGWIYAIRKDGGIARYSVVRDASTNLCPRETLADITPNALVACGKNVYFAMSNGIFAAVVDTTSDPIRNDFDTDSFTQLVPDEIVSMIAFDNILFCTDSDGTIRRLDPAYPAQFDTLLN